MTYRPAILLLCWFVKINIYRHFNLFSVTHYESLHVGCHVLVIFFCTDEQLLYWECNNSFGDCWPVFPFRQGFGWGAEVLCFVFGCKNMWKNLLVCLLQEHRNIARKFCMFLRKVLPSRDFDPLKKKMVKSWSFFSRSCGSSLRVVKTSMPRWISGYI